MEWSLLKPSYFDYNSFTNFVWGLLIAAFSSLIQQHSVSVISSEAALRQATASQLVNPTWEVLLVSVSRGVATNYITLQIHFLCCASPHQPFLIWKNRCKIENASCLLSLERFHSVCTGTEPSTDEQRGSAVSLTFPFSCSCPPVGCPSISIDSTFFYFVSSIQHCRPVWHT